MSVALLTPEVRRILADVNRRLGILERHINPTSTSAGAATNAEIIFSYAGALVSSTESPPVKIRYGGFLATLAVALGTAGSSDTTLTVKINGTVVATVVVASSVADATVEVGMRVNAEDRLSLDVDTAGTGAADMTAAARFT